MKTMSQVARIADCPETLEEARLIIQHQDQEIARLRAENAKFRKAGQRLAALLAQPAGSDGHVWPDLDDEIRPALDAWAEAKP